MVTTRVTSKPELTRLLIMPLYLFYFKTPLFTSLFFGTKHHFSQISSAIQTNVFSFIPNMPVTLKLMQEDLIP